ncbi:hypothetical protein [Marinobacter caseinilyticus]|uniref:hypothetical protein n=1 Tax=Marinobacter caseinilyticus TaxID=2692195 RepID=UPI00140C36C0|nr:hypothetical protein [Marinobacter caseinilyticus]
MDNGEGGVLKRGYNAEEKHGQTFGWTDRAVGVRAPIPLRLGRWQSDNPFVPTGRAYRMTTGDAEPALFACAGVGDEVKLADQKMNFVRAKS